MTCGTGVDVCVRGQHIYKDIWYAVIGELLVCKREPNNFQDRYFAVAVKKENSVSLIFAHKATRENILTAKITQTTVCSMNYGGPIGRAMCRLPCDDVHATIDDVDMTIDDVDAI